MNFAPQKTAPWWMAPLFLAGLAGCGGGTGELPDELTVTLPDNSVVTVSEGSGASSLANSKWQFYRMSTNGQGAVFAVIVFGSDGNLEKFEDNTLAANLFGDEIVFDNTRRATKQSGLTYSAATYGAETGDATGFTFEGRFTAFAAGFKAGEASASAMAEYDPDNPDHVSGMFAFTSEVTIVDMPEANVSDEFHFGGDRVE